MVGRRASTASRAPTSSPYHDGSITWAHLSAPEHHDVVALGEIGDQLRVGDAGVEPRSGLGDRQQDVEAMVDGHQLTVVLAQRRPREHEVDPVESALLDRGRRAIARCATVGGLNDPGYTPIAMAAR